MIKNYLLFTTRTCPACPRVKEFLSGLKGKGIINGENLEIETDKGYEKSVEFKVNRAPTVILFDETKREVARAYNVGEIRSIIYDY